MNRTDPRITLRPVECWDSEFLYTVYASTREEEMALIPWSPEQKDRFLRMQFDMQSRYYHTHYPAHFASVRFDVVELNGMPAGQLYTARSETEVRLVNIALLPAGRNLGTGTRLISELLQEAGQGGLCVRLHVDRGNPAGRLYRRLGFVEIGGDDIRLLMEWRAAVNTA